MKNVFKLSFLLFAFLCIGCDTLDLVPVSSKSVEGFYKTELQIEQAVNGAYASLQRAFVTENYSYMLTEAASDNAFQGTEYDDGSISRATVTPSLPILYQAWSVPYAGINRCNQVLKKITDVPMSDTKRQQFTGEAKLIRALLYFDLVRMFGKAVKVTEPVSIDESYDVPAASAEEIYDLIVTDLTEAANLLPSSYDAGNLGRATSWTAKGFLGKVYVFRSGYPLKKNEWDKAKSLFEEIINSGNFEFAAKYEDIYSHANESGKQSVFSIRFSNTIIGEGNPFPRRNAPNPIAKDDVLFGGSPFNLFLSADLVNSFEVNDVRKNVAIRSSWKKNTGDIITNEPFSQKYLNGPINENGWDIDWIALGYTDILLMHAECLNEIGYVANGEALKTLNRVRERAGLKARTSAEIPDQNSFRLAMEIERRHEFCFENLRWFDLVRTNRALEVKRKFLSAYNLEGNMKSENQYFYPIPQRVINVSPVITQNAGY
jgi:hypothetical protein